MRISKKKLNISPKFERQVPVLKQLWAFLSKTSKIFNILIIYKIIIRTAKINFTPQIHLSNSLLSNNNHILCSKIVLNFKTECSWHHLNINNSKEINFLRANNILNPNPVCTDKQISLSARKSINHSFAPLLPILQII